MKFIKKHTIEFTALVVFLILLIGGGIFFISMWNQGSGSKYGTRLEGINSVKISNDKLKKIEKKLDQNENVSKVSSNIEGRVINFMIVVNNGTNPDSAKELSNILMDKCFSKKELEFYDIQLYLSEKDAASESVYPKIGYKGKSSDKFIWSNN